MAQHIFINNTRIKVTSDTPNDVIRIKANDGDKQDKDDPFFLGDLDDVVGKYKQWTTLLPRVTPFYAVKCNDSPAVLGVLERLGTGFDCTSQGELETILGLGVDVSRIVYANPCKQTSHIHFAAEHQVSMITFDNEYELYKIKADFPTAKLIIRIMPVDDSKSRFPLGEKYGCHPDRTRMLLELAEELQLNVIGVSFHIGSGCSDKNAFGDTLVRARSVFDMALDLGFHFGLMDIGGGFPGSKSDKISFEEICDVLRPALDTCFPESMGVRIIAEPGRYFVESAFTLVLKVIGKRSVNLAIDTDGAVEKLCDPSFMYYLNDGQYGSIHPDDFCSDLQIIPLRDISDERTYTSIVWGPTCAAGDYISKDHSLPELNNGDWVFIKNIGAYSMCLASDFSSMPRSRCHYIIHREATGLLRDHQLCPLQ